MDNFIVGHDVSAALAFAEESWRPKYKVYEVKAAAEQKIKDAEKASKRAERRYDILCALRTECYIYCRGDR